MRDVQRAPRRSGGRRPVSGREATNGTVRGTISEVTAACLMPPLLAERAQAEPGIDVELVASNAITNLLRREADIAVRMARPRAGLTGRTQACRHPDRRGGAPSLPGAGRHASAAGRADRPGPRRDDPRGLCADGIADSPRAVRAAHRPPVGLRPAAGGRGGYRIRGRLQPSTLAEAIPRSLEARTDTVARSRGNVLRTASPPPAAARSAR